MVESDLPHASICGECIGRPPGVVAARIDETGWIPPLREELKPCSFSAPPAERISVVSLLAPGLNGAVPAADVLLPGGQIDDETLVETFNQCPIRQRPEGRQSDACAAMAQLALDAQKRGIVQDPELPAMFHLNVHRASRPV